MKAVIGLLSSLMNIAILMQNITNNSINNLILVYQMYLYLYVFALILKSFYLKFAWFEIFLDECYSVQVA